MAGNAVLMAIAARAKSKAKTARQRNNENTAKFFAAGMCGMIFLFILFHWTRFLFKRYGRQKTRISRLLDIPRRIARYLKSHSRK